MATVAGNQQTRKRSVHATVSKLQSARYENKYIVSERIARKIYDFVRCYLGPDQFTEEGYTKGYPVHSLYLDSPDLHTCNATVQGHKNRFKLRIRFYDNKPDSPVFCEIKRREEYVILKQRAMIYRQAVDDLLAGAPPAHEYLVKNDAKNWKALYDFCRLRDKIDARPTAYTSYFRAGYEPADNNSVRVTFDRDIRAGKYEKKLEAANAESWPNINVPGVVLELKFTDRFPNWMHDLTQTFNLRKGSMPKYVECVSLLRAI